MNRWRLFYFFIIPIVVMPVIVIAGEIKLEGIYRGQDVFVRNPFSGEINGFCVSSIKLNNKILSNIPKTSAIRIDLSGHKIGDIIRIIIQHDDSCQPRIVNPEVLREIVDFQFIYARVDHSSINWITSGESQTAGQFIVEKLGRDGWRELITVPGKGSMDNNQYSVEANHYSGGNQYRIVFDDVTGVRHVTEELEFYSALDPIKIYQGKKIYDYISLSRVTDFEIYSITDSLLMKGIGEEINVSSLPYGDFYMIIENEPFEFYREAPEIIPERIKRKKKDNKRKTKDNNL